jgi:uncharacterized protein YndB with AHSA1/START domain
MRYRVETTINLPRDRVIELFDDPDTLGKWQDGFLGIELIEGEPRTDGSKSRLRYASGRGEMEMIETITKYDLPDEFSCTYEADGVLNIHKNFFTEEDGATRWVADTEFRFSRFGMKIMGALMPFMFKSQTKKMMADFKAFAEATG